MASTNGRVNGLQSLNSYVKSVCDIMRRANCAGALQYVPELTWMLFLRILDEREEDETASAAAVGSSFTPSIGAPYRWRDWAARDGKKRVELTGQGSTLGDFMRFIDGGLIPHLRALKGQPAATPRQKVVSEVFSNVERSRIDTERNLLDIIDKLDDLQPGSVDDTHIFTLSQIYEGLLLKMGEKNNDGGQFFTPREIIRAMIRAVAPQVGEKVYDPCCGTGGFLAQSYEFMRPQAEKRGPDAIQLLGEQTFYGREKDNLAYPIALANLVLHGIDDPHIWHGNTLSDQMVYGGLFEGAPSTFDVVLTNPPFGGKEGKEAQTRFAFKTGSTQVLFIQEVMNRLKDDGRCAIVVDEGFLFRTNENAFVQTKRKLLDEFDVWSIISLPAGVFMNAGAASKTNLLFFTKGTPTQSVWYYDLADVKVTKRQPFTVDRFDGFFELLPTRGESERSWTVPVAVLKDKNYDLKAVNPNRKSIEDTRTPEQLLDIIDEQGKLVAEAVSTLRASLPGRSN
ncbi:MAG TPA: N-6 DNA methylase [Dehalococcoidia bacterium]